MKKIVGLVVLIIIFTGLSIGVYADKEINEKQKNNGDIVSLKENIKVNSEINGNVVSVFGNITIDATVNGDVTVVLGNIELKDKGVVNGNVTAGKSIIKSDKAKINGSTTSGFVSYVDLKKIGSPAELGAKIFILAGNMVFMLLGLLVVLIFRKRLSRIMIDIEYDIHKKIGIGILAYLIVLVGLALLGILIIPVLIYACLIIIADTITCLYIGKVILKYMNIRSNMYTQFITGFFVTFLIRLIVIVFCSDTLVMLWAANLGVSVIIDSLGLGILVFYMKLERPAKKLK